MNPTSTVAAKVIDTLTFRDTSGEIEQEGMLRLLSENLAGLPDLQKKLLSLYYIEGLRFSELAEVFCLSEARVCEIHKLSVRKLQTSIRQRSEKHQGKDLHYE